MLRLRALGACGDAMPPVFTPEEQAAMDRGYTMAERRQISGRMFGIYPQAISLEHAAKLDQLRLGKPHIVPK